MASITKLMTALVALERASPDEVVTVTAGAARIGESTINLRRASSSPSATCSVGR